MSLRNLLALLLFCHCAIGAEFKIKPGEDPQAVLDAASPGDKLTLLPGLHQHGLKKHRSILYVDKAVEIELAAGATLKLADDETKLENTPEITTDQDAGKKLDDLEMGGAFDLSNPCIFTIKIDSEGSDDRADTFEWGVFESADNPQGNAKLKASENNFAATTNKKVPITGDWQPLTHGVKIRFGKTTGHNKGSVWFSTYDGPAAYGIRIGHGRQPDYISGVRITGKGMIDMNASHNVQPGFLVKDINACVLVHGRVRNVLVEGITMQDTNRSVMCYGEHSGKFLPGGEVGEGESFDAENITILQTRTINPNGAGYLLGHPSFRGKLRNVKCNYNYMETGVTAIEPNFNLDGYEVIGNVIKSGGEFGVIHCWRHSKNGVVTDNLRIHDYTTKPVVALGAPRGWQSPERPVMRNNRNHLSEFPGRASTEPPPPFGRRLLVSDYVGNKVAIVAADGRIEWQTPAERPQDSWMLPNGNVLFSHVHGAKEVRPDQSVAWEYVADPKTEVQGCQPLADGRVLVVECGTSRLIEVDRDGKIAKEIKVPLVTTRTHEQLRGCRKQPDGRYLVSAKGDRAVLEFSAEGKLLRTQPVNGDIHDVRELADGHWLVALGEGDGVVEYDRSGKIVWSIGRNEIANNHLYLVSSVERLNNGHTVVMNWLGHGHLGATAQIFEIDANKQVLRQFSDHQNFSSINHIQVLE